ncbi:MAG: hypothetical protein NTV94_02020 [Planctomycetota bacterium]|nr:hypothetical protein [Planctomycetota bacterium]
MEELTRRNILGSMAALAASSLALPALAAAIDTEPPSDTEILVPGGIVPIRVTSVRSIINLRAVITYVTVYLVAPEEGPPTAGQLQVWVSMSTAHRKGFGIPLELVSAQVVVGRTKWNTPLTTPPGWIFPGNISASAINGPGPGTVVPATVAITYKVNGRKRTQVIRNVPVTPPGLILS